MGGFYGIGHVFVGSYGIIGLLGGFDKVFKGISCIAKISGGLASFMFGFDLLAWGIDLFDSSNPETFERAEKPVVKTYVHKVTQLVHLKINKELITTTNDHPFYVKGKGIARNFESSGGFDQTLKDFDSLNPLNVKDIQTQYGSGKVGRLSDGATVVAQPGSTTGGATLEIRVSNSKVFKIRY